MSEQEKRKVGRREFLRTLGAGAGVAAAAAAPMVPAGASAQANDPRTKARYQDAKQVQTFYRVNGYETLKK